jgi:hypothetical protein
MAHYLGVGLLNGARAFGLHLVGEALGLGLARVVGGRLPGRSGSRSRPGSRCRVLPMGGEAHARPAAQRAYVAGMGQ